MNSFPINTIVTYTKYLSPFLLDCICCWPIEMIYGIYCIGNLKWGWMDGWDIWDRTAMFFTCGLTCWMELDFHALVTKSTLALVLQHKVIFGVSWNWPLTLRCGAIEWHILINFLSNYCQEVFCRKDFHLSAPPLETTCNVPVFGNVDWHCVADEGQASLEHVAMVAVL